MWGVFGWKVGGLEGYCYLVVVLVVDFVWMFDKFNEWLFKLKDFFFGNKMFFVGLFKE